MGSPIFWLRDFFVAVDILTSLFIFIIYNREEWFLFEIYI